MLFNSAHFIVFFPIVILVYYVLPQRGRYLWLLAASYYFYMSWNPKYIVLLLFSTAVTYASGRLLAAAKNTTRRKLIVAASFILNLGVLFYFKYVGMAADILVRVLGKLHIYLTIPSFDVVLPVGISFFTFQALSYTVDVYRGEIYAEKNFFRYALYVSFFPQLVAGPIERSKNLLKQLAVPKTFEFERAREGIFLMLWGYFLKLVLADRIAIVVDTVYNHYTEYQGWYFIVATVLFAFQIYCDFAGYSTIAIGAAKILGVRLMENFDAPYTAQSVAEFWRRWHISLTSWFRDYLYIPLMPIRERLIRLFRLNPDSFGFRLYRTLVTFVLVDLSWVYFRAEGFRAANTIVRSMVTAKNPWVLFDGSLYTLGLDGPNFRLMIVSIFILLAADIAKRCGITIREKIIEQDYLFRWVFIACAVVFILLFGVWGPGYSAANFIYFQF